MNEIFKDIIGYEGLYQVSNLGRVKSLPKGDGNGYRERILKTDATRSYYCVSLSKDGKVKRIFNHVLVATHFIPNPLNKPQINHIDSNKFNNNVLNLEWVTISENAIHAFKAGRLTEGFEKSKEVLAIKRAEYNLSVAKEKLQNRFIKMSYKGYRTYIHYNCFYCGEESISRTDAPIYQHKGRCKNYSCKVKEDNDIV